MLPGGVAGDISSFDYDALPDSAESVICMGFLRTLKPRHCRNLEAFKPNIQHCNMGALFLELGLGPLYGLDCAGTIYRVLYYDLRGRSEEPQEVSDCACVTFRCKSSVWV